MKLEESYDKNHCDECGDYGYTFEITLDNDDYPKLRLCKKCLLKLLKAIIER